MTGPEHYATAERVFEDAKAAQPGSDQERFLLAAAQVHATLALAAATALLGPVSATGFDDTDLAKWHEVAGVKGSEEAEEEPEASCRLCGCTENAGCEGGCHWVPDPLMLGDLCSTCRDAALALAAALQQEGGEG